METIRLHIAYDGTRYCGWQIQPDDPTVEGELTRAVTQILDADSPVKVQGASRTDSGVHAVGQVAHFRHDTGRSLWDFSRGLNALTDDDICVVRVEPADDEFHARHSARGKIYRYRIWNHRFVHPFLRRRTWHVPVQLDVDAMIRIAQLLEGEHDFAGFRAASCESETTVRTMHRVEVLPQPPSMIEVVVEGTSFLQHMVRIMVGTLVDVGKGKFGAHRVRKVLEDGDRCRGGVTAPAGGLTLQKVFYPDFDWKGDEPAVGELHMPPDELPQGESDRGLK